MGFRYYYDEIDNYYSMASSMSSYAGKVYFEKNVN